MSPDHGHATEPLSLEEALDKHPCGESGGHYNNHHNLSKDESWDDMEQV